MSEVSQFGCTDEALNYIGSKEKEATREAEDEEEGKEKGRGVDPHFLRENRGLIWKDLNQWKAEEKKLFFFKEIDLNSERTTSSWMAPFVREIQAGI